MSSPCWSPRILPPPPLPEPGEAPAPRVPGEEVRPGDQKAEPEQSRLEGCSPGGERGPRLLARTVWLSRRFEPLPTSPGPLEATAFCPRPFYLESLPRPRTHSPQRRGGSSPPGFPSLLGPAVWRELGGNKVGRGLPTLPPSAVPQTAITLLIYLITASQEKTGVSPPGPHCHRRVPLPQSLQAALPPTPTATHTPGPGLVETGQC